VEAALDKGIYIHICTYTSHPVPSLTSGDFAVVQSVCWIRTTIYLTLSSHPVLCSYGPCYL